MNPSELAHVLRAQGEPVFMGLGATVFLLEGRRYVEEPTFPGDTDHALGATRILNLPWHLGEDHFTALQRMRKIA